jgi:transposase
LPERTDSPAHPCRPTETAPPLPTPKQHGAKPSPTPEQWPALLQFVSDGRIQIDNNEVENAIRPTAVGKKNYLCSAAVMPLAPAPQACFERRWRVTHWLFIGAADAGERGAILYTLAESCRRRGLDPFAYLRDVLERLPRMTNTQIPSVTPATWAKAQRTSQHLRAA